MDDGLFLPRDGDPLFGGGSDGGGSAAPAKPRRIPRKTEAFARTGWRALASRSNDDVFPPLTRLCLYLQIRSRDGLTSVSLTNSAVLDLGLSRWQKRRLLIALEEAGRITVSRRRGCHPVVTIVRLWW